MKKRYTFIGEYILRWTKATGVKLNRLIDDYEDNLEKIFNDHSDKIKSNRRYKYILRDSIEYLLANCLGNGHEVDVDGYYIYSPEDIHYVEGHFVFDKQFTQDPSDFNVSIEIQEGEKLSVLRNIASIINIEPISQTDPEALGLQIMDFLNPEKKKEISNRSIVSKTKTFSIEKYIKKHKLLQTSLPQIKKLYAIIFVLPSDPITIEDFSKVYNDKMVFVYRYKKKFTMRQVNEYEYGIFRKSPDDLLIRLFKDANISLDSIEIYPLGRWDKDFASTVDFPTDKCIYLTPRLYKLYTDKESYLWVKRKKKRKLKKTELPIPQFVDYINNDVVHSMIYPQTLYNNYGYTWEDCGYDLDVEPERTDWVLKHPISAYLIDPMGNIYKSWDIED